MLTKFGFMLYNLIKKKEKVKKMEYYNISKPIKALLLNSVGEEHCSAGHFNGPKVRENYLFHFIVSGEGEFHINERKYRLAANQAFLIADSSIVYYKANEKNPWHYCWIAIKGDAAKEFFDNLSLSPTDPIYTAKPNNQIYEYFKELLNAASDYPMKQNLTTACLYRYFSELEESNFYKKEISVSQKKLYIQKAEKYILSNYHSDSFRISDLADYLNLNRSYITVLFSQKYNLSPQQYLIRLRMNKAQELLKNTSIPVGIIANSVGYPDLITFSKIYKKYFGVSPTKDRNMK